MTQDSHDFSDIDHTIAEMRQILENDKKTKLHTLGTWALAGSITLNVFATAGPWVSLGTIGLCAVSVIANYMTIKECDAEKALGAYIETTGLDYIFSYIPQFEENFEPRDTAADPVVDAMYNRAYECAENCDHVGVLAQVEAMTEYLRKKLNA